MSAPLVAIASLLFFASTAFAPSFAHATEVTQTPAKTATAPAKTSPGAGPVIVVETEKGTFEFETYPNEAPKTVAHIIGLINKRFYNGQRFHRVIPGFVAQWGEPLTRDMTKEKLWGGGGSGKPVGVGEFSKLRTHVRGAVGLAHPGNAGEGDSQIYVTLSSQPSLNGKFTVLGKVISGMEVLDKIRQPDRIVRVTVREAK
jgi:cyclophilin family peptidyl-prolyl cis-trans isomerase